ncbi:MAG: acyltransferase [Eubacteriales bacterium]|nr:acyltransferase [Eubacteriales bacterium]
MPIRKLYRAYQQKKARRRIAPYVRLSGDSHYGGGFSVDLREPQDGHIYLSVGAHCVVDGSFVFESRGGSVSVGDRVFIGSSTFISINHIEIEDDVSIAWNCLFYDHNSHSVNWEERQFDTEKVYQNLSSGLPSLRDKDWSVVKNAPIRICKKAWIGEGVTVLKGVTIGEGAVVGAGSVVTKDVEPWTVVAGNPARTVRKLEHHPDL